jgi:hypothetical protein
MHQLTIDDDRTPVAVSGHPSFHDAHRALLRYVIGADRYLHTVDDTAEYTRYRLLCLADPDDPQPARAPRITGTATIEQLPHIGLPARADDHPHTDQAAREAVQHNAISRHAPDNPPATTAAVAQRLPADTSEQRTDALICYHPLRWGADSP